MLPALSVFFHLFEKASDFAGSSDIFLQRLHKRYNERTVSPFNDLQSPTDIVLLAVLSHPRLKLGFRDVVELLLQHGYMVSYESIRFWKFRFAPLISDRLRARRRGRAGRSWYLDETYSRVGGRWRYLVEP